MTSLIDLPFDILHQLVLLCDKADLLALQVVCRRLTHFIVPYVDRQLAIDIELGICHHLHRAVASSGYYQQTMVQRLLDAGAPVNQHDKTGETALHVAARYGNFDGVYHLLRAGAEVDATTAHGWTALHLACRYGCMDIARGLIASGADVNKPGFHGWTALHYAVRGRHIDCVRALLEYDSAVEVCDSDGRTAVNEAKHQGWIVYSCFVVD